jgi:hypothetical protein
MAVSSAGLRPQRDCSGKTQKQLYSNLQTRLQKHQIDYHRYVDDILIIYDETHANIQDTLHDFNNIHSNIQYTMETAINNKLNYLDITIETVNNAFRFNIFNISKTNYYRFDYP